MGQRTVIIVQHDNKRENTKETRLFYHQWGIGRILPSQLVSVLNGTLSVSKYSPDYLKELQPQGTADVTDTDGFTQEELAALDFNNPKAVGNAMKAVDNNNGGIFVKITTSDKIGQLYDKIEYAYMLGSEDGGNYKKFCRAETWMKKAGGKYIDHAFISYYNQVLNYFEAKEIHPKKEEDNVTETKVVFRKFGNGEIIALFPEEREKNGLVLSYMHIGQHSMADPSIVHDTKPATPLEYTKLADELTIRGYNLRIMKKMTRNN